MCIDAIFVNFRPTVSSSQIHDVKFLPCQGRGASRSPYSCFPLLALPVVIKSGLSGLSASVSLWLLWNVLLGTAAVPSPAQPRFASLKDWQGGKRFAVAPDAGSSSAPRKNGPEFPSFVTCECVSLSCLLSSHLSFQGKLDKNKITSVVAHQEKEAYCSMRGSLD